MNPSPRRKSVLDSFAWGNRPFPRSCAGEKKCNKTRTPQHETVRGRTQPQLKGRKEYCFGILWSLSWVYSRPYSAFLFPLYEKDWALKKKKKNTLLVFSFWGFLILRRCVSESSLHLRWTSYFLEQISGNGRQGFIRRPYDKSMSGFKILKILNPRYERRSSPNPRIKRL